MGRPVRMRDIGALFVLGALWGASFLFIRVAVPALGPAVLMDLRVLLAAATLVAYAATFGRLGGFRARWRQFVLLGGLNAAVPFTLIASAELTLTASLASILNATTPLFTAVVAAVWIGEKLTLRKLAGLSIGMAGVGVLVGWNPQPLTPVVVLSVCASLAAALSYGLGGVYAKRAFPGVPPLTMAIGQLTAAAVCLLPLATATVPHNTPSAAEAGATLALALASTALAYLLYFRLIANVGPTNTLTVTFLVPIFGTLLGVGFLNEPFGPSMLLGAGVVLVGVALVTGVRPRLPGQAKQEVG